jgi:8-oxo-dGTP diphosphatase
MSSNRPGSRLIRAAGGVAWRPGPDGEPEILLVHRTKYDDWSLPKGKTEPGEALPVTAVREVLEEGGAQLALGRRLTSVRYNVGGRPKRVHYWAARVLSVDAQAVPNHEVDAVTWLPARRAVDKVSYAHDHGVLADFAARPAGTFPLILARHAKAQEKTAWKRDDVARPLSDDGRADARALAGLLACFAPRQLITSTAVRCADTLRPLAQLTGAPLRDEPALYLHHQPSRTERGASELTIDSLVREVIAAGQPTVLCAHRENIPGLRRAALAALAGHPGGSARGTGPDGDSAVPGALTGLAELPKDWDDPLPTCGFWVLNIAPLPAGQFAAGQFAAGQFAAGQLAKGQLAAGQLAAGQPSGTAGTNETSAPPAGPSRRWWRWGRSRRRGRSGMPASAAAVGAALEGVPRGSAAETQRGPGALGDPPVGSAAETQRGPGALGGPPGGSARVGPVGPADSAGPSGPNRDPPGGSARVGPVGPADSAGPSGPNGDPPGGSARVGPVGPADSAGPSGPNRDLPVGLLVSADRYDLSGC